jgi:hypothetical protein
MDFEERCMSLAKDVMLGLKVSSFIWVDSMMFQFTIKDIGRVEIT